MDYTYALDAVTRDPPEAVDPAGVLVHHVDLEVGIVPLLNTNTVTGSECLQLLYLLLQIINNDIQKLFKVSMDFFQLTVLLW